MTEVNVRILKKPKNQRKVKINPYTGNYHFCQSRSAAISRNIELMDLSGDKYTKRFATIQHPFGASTTTPSTLSDPSQQCHKSANATQPCHKSPDVNNNHIENLITTLTTATRVKIDTTVKHEEKKKNETTSRKRSKQSKGTSSKRQRRSLSYSESEYMKELEQFLKG